MDSPSSTARARQVITGLSFILVPLVFAFAVHPELLRPRLLGPEGLVLRARGQELLHLGHGLVTLVTIPLFVATPDGMEIVSLTASVLLAIAFVPQGLGLLRAPRTLATRPGQPGEAPLRRSA